SSAAMRLSQQEMHFFSFGFHHHDICLVKHHKLKMDNNSMLHFTLAVKDADAFEDVRRHARDMGLPIREGRMLASARPVSRAFCIRDPDKHWIEIIEEPSR
ncbi:MAG: VOC family protein, partial [Pararhizobium sp.]